MSDERIHPRLLLSGSRSLGCPDHPTPRIYFCDRCAWCYQQVSRAIAFSGFKPEMVISGQAVGPDRIVEVWAARRKKAVTTFPAEWKAHGKKAGILRNLEMLYQADQVVVVWDGRSRGACHVIGEAKRRGLPLYVHMVAA